MAKDEGYYSFEHNQYLRKGKSDAATQTSPEIDFGKFYYLLFIVSSWKFLYNKNGCRD